MKTTHVITLISRIRERANKLIEKELQNQGLEGMVASHGALLSALYKNNGKLTMKEIATAIERDKSTVTELVNKLMLYGYVEKVKDIEDGRVTHILLTVKGVNAKGKFDAVSKKLLNTVYCDVSQDERELLIGILERLKDNLA
ncbi:MarR family winged helix-turn-helix transcriptional regulator [Alkaliphilus peptidifermentans]|uniref:DNA-binding transcriptional regulator, MarR family n=1 Tax=Alkaliphilus peptidifermentans DSM 18978 TaxID=1120976 RepID=A0A1G5KYA4_9FIRM|nr:MarR family winged helix-turn-helix transcriptional regulator [Alkaliphilus peptidifermentans]SCZ05673.1 DNA-binding transcriptional regulator, MarR family [Alkaliphilus peptidifermentans DSM 18978]